MTVDRCAIARETADYLTPETWTTGELIDTPEEGGIGDESAMVDYLKEHTNARCPVCLYGSLIRACYVHIPNYDYGDEEHYNITLDLGRELADTIESGSVGAFGTITQFNDDTEYDEYDEEVDRFFKVKDVANRFADRVCHPGS